MTAWRWKVLVAILAAILALGASAPAHAHKKTHGPKQTENRKDAAFRAGYDDGYRAGANDAQSQANYNDEGGAYQQATDGYTRNYGDKETYQKRFRHGYLQGYRAGWNFTVGMYGPTGPVD